MVMRPTEGTLAESASASDRGRGRQSELSRSWRRFKRYRPGLAGTFLILLLILIAIFAPVLAPYSPEKVDTSRMGEAPSWSHPLGFDGIGRDVLSRTIYGTRVALLVGLLSTLISVVIGVAVGATAGFFGGAIDTVLSRIVDTLMAFPLLVLLVTLSAVFSPSLKTTIIVIGVSVWASYARLVRADVLSLRERDFIQSARAAGATNARIIWRHVVPNVLGPVIVIATLGVGGIIILEAALSFLGLGVQPPTPSWGGDLSSARQYLEIYPHMAIAPGIMITITVLAFNLLGDGLRDALDPRQRE
ncbi:MAG TPA: ABC transporter permease [Thermomicrobiales bacterium]|jgi:peptide/nickel transport system permease protein|nr:ABC transporter permease [Thermomicrobiales bacterium]